MPAVNTDAAPIYQIALACNLMMAQWTFDNIATGANSSPGYSLLASDVASATSTAGNGLGSPTISAAPKGWYANNFAIQI